LVEKKHTTSNSLKENLIIELPPGHNDRFQFMGFLQTPSSCYSKLLVI
jgi:hypothetical protein